MLLQKILGLIFSFMYLVSVDPMDRSLVKNLLTLVADPKLAGAKPEALL